MEGLKLLFERQEVDQGDGVRRPGVLIPTLLKEDSTLLVREIWDQKILQEKRAVLRP
jgi:hypothetical protein